MKFCCGFIILFVFSSPSLTMQAIPILSESMSKEAWLNFAKVGCGYYPIPEALKKYLALALEMANSLNASRAGQYGYSCEAKQQVEILMLEEKDWGKFLPHTQVLAQGMSKIGKNLVVKLLQAIGVNADLYAKITGGLSSSGGKNYFKIAHYDSSKNLSGIDWHKDIRWITVLFINQPGLQGKINDKVINIDPLEGFFVINLGVFFEAFINDRQLLTALEHQVLQVQQDRVSFGVFCSGDYPEQGFYQLENRRIIWRDPEHMQLFLIEDKSQRFSIKAHSLFDD